MVAPKECLDTAAVLPATHAASAAANRASSSVRQGAVTSHSAGRNAACIYEMLTGDALRPREVDEGRATLPLVLPIARLRICI